MRTSFGNAIDAFYGNILVSPTTTDATRAGIRVDGASGNTNGCFQAQTIGAAIAYLAQGAAATQFDALSFLQTGQHQWAIRSPASSNSFTIVDGTAGTTPLAISGTGRIDFADINGTVWNSATGGQQGTGTINATGLFVNGVVVSTGGSTVLVAAKTAVTNRPSTSAPTLDPTLFVTVPSTGTYRLQVLANVSSVAAAAGIKMAVMGTATTTAIQERGSVTDNSGAEIFQSGTGTLSFLSVSISGTGSAILDATVVVSVVGTLGFGWSQAVSTASNTGMNNGSLIVTKVG